VALLTLAACAGAPRAEPAASGAGASAAARIAALPDPGGRAWDAAVRGELLALAGQEAGGGVATAGDVEALPCEVLSALDDALREAHGSSLQRMYGLEEGLRWAGDVLGIRASARAPLKGRLARCGVRPFDPVAPAPGDDAVVEAIYDLAPQGGTPAWEMLVHDLLVSAYDADASGLVDDPAEVDAMSCRLFFALTEAVLAGTNLPLSAAYGFDPGWDWRGASLGFSLRVRDEVFDALLDCGVALDIAPW